MGAVSLSGAKTIAMKATRGTLVVGNGTIALAPNAWYEIESVKTTGSTLPIGKVTAIFKTPDTSSTAITPAIGDKVYPLTLETICKTDAEVTAEEGTIDVTDDCEHGYNASILDGYATISGSLNGFMKFDDATGELVTGAREVLGRFFDVVTDDGEGVYTVESKDNGTLLLMICMNRDAKVGQVQNWLIVPAILSSLGTGAGLKDVQKRDLSWTKAQGYASVYQRTVFAADVIS
jgi:hypothetical protein